MFKSYEFHICKCDICNRHEKSSPSTIKENFENHDESVSDFMDRMKKEKWLIDDNKVICPRCRTGLEKIGML